MTHPLCIRIGCAGPTWQKWLEDEDDFTAEEVDEIFERLAMQDPRMLVFVRRRAVYATIAPEVLCPVLPRRIRRRQYKMRKCWKARAAGRVQGMRGRCSV